MNHIAHPAIDRDASACLFCGKGDLDVAFVLKVFRDSHDATYHRCAACQSLQISRVAWLADAYADAGDDIDTGSVQRSFLTAMLVRALRQSGLLTKGARALDYGAGLGLLVRLLRDGGFDAWGVDKYRKMHECDAFQIDQHAQTGKMDILILIEVLEHLVRPHEELAALAARLSERGCILVRTGLYDHRIHGPNWWYLLAHRGGHINFASRKGLTSLAHRIGMEAVFLPAGYCLMVKSRTLIHLRCMLAAVCFLCNAALARSIGLLDFRHAAADSELIESANGRRSTD